MKPYRLNAKSTEQGAAEAPSLEWDLVAPFALLWLTSLVQVACALISRRAFGGQDTLASLALLALPALLVRGAAAA